MADCNPVQNCKSKRCAQAGVCNCLLVYSDGSQVPGSGTGDDPYVIKTPPIQVITDANGTPIVPDGNKVVTLPNALSRIISLDTGVEYIPDSRGRILLPTAAIGTMSFRDEYGNLLSVENNDVIKFVLDGDDGVIQGKSGVFVDPIAKEIRFPSMKTAEIEFNTLSLSVPDFYGSNGGFLNTIGSFADPHVDSPNNNDSFYPATFCLQFYFDGTAYDPGSTDDYFKFDLEVVHTSTVRTVASNVGVSGDRAGCYNSFSFKKDLIAEVGAPPKSLRLIITDNHMTNSRWSNMKLEAQVVMEYI